MSQERWTAVDQYVAKLLFPSDPALEQALESSRAAGLPEIQVTPAQGRLLQLLAGAHGSQKILEIGTLGGYSTIWLARALPPGGRLITLEVNPKHAEVARGNLARAGLVGAVDVVVGNALETLPSLKIQGPFDFIFIDADKPGNADYFEWALRLSRLGSLIVVDNVVRDGAVVDENGDANVQGVRRLMERISVEPRVEATVVQTVGTKGYDGFAIAVVL